MRKQRITADQLKGFVSYDADSGEFKWIRRLSIRVYVGKRAGTPLKSGHRKLTIDGVQYLEHRLAWLYVYGKWPTGEIDHIDGDPSNNKIVNLRDVSHKTNMENIRRAYSGNTSGLLGAGKHRRKWVAKIRNGKTLVYLGAFNTPEEAHAAYVAAKRIIHSGCTI